MQSPVSAGEMSAGEQAEWCEFAAQHGYGHFYHHPGWGRLIEEVFGHRTLYWSVRDADGRLRGILPLVEMRSRLFGRFQVSVPFVNYGGAIGDSGDIEERLLSAATAHAQRRGMDFVEYRESRPRDGNWQVRTDKVSMLLSLPEDPDLLWKRFPGKLRSQIRRPLKEGARFQSGGSELLSDFYRVFARNMRDLGTPVYPKRFFSAILTRFREQATIGLVRIGREPVAAGLLLTHGGRTEIPWASSVRRWNRIGVNMLLYWGALSEAIVRGSRVFDFGRSTRDGGTYRFKQQWGATPRQLYWLYWVTEGAERPGLRPDNPRYRNAINVWKRLPLPVANRLGPLIVRNLP